ncbi:hypothetical protein DEF23_12515 [Marinitenerispora sediminis]|uniref:Uncharacterized protein n=1 Tax=Marinitenerispora sediminis TaxID=1931232 RepID=A0A368T7J3_9ACTN|nr:hypothetical protein DEF28_16915 [Marinitenerispora sediminis]RCV56499.1 hypothetical protein DEF23_12515 [Marinitenerispora sediminis]RCV59587.1 hypothetical protein DEF24_09295 [Marinitenerispora sediminis]
MFGAGAVGALRPSERDRGEAWSLVGFAGLLLQNAAFAGVVALRLALAHDSTAAPALWALHDALFTLNGTFLALALLGLSVGGLRAGLIHPWHGGLGLLAAALLLASATLAPLVIEHGAPLGLLGLTGWLLWVVWIVGYGIVLMRLAPAPRPHVPEPAG